MSIPAAFLVILALLVMRWALQRQREQRQAYSKSLLEGARKHLNESMYAHAIRRYTKLIKMHPKTALFYVERSLAYTEANQTEKALEDLGRVNMAKLKDASIMGLAGIIYMRLGKYDAAEKAALRAVDMNPNLPEARQTLVEIYMKRHKWARAAEVLLGLAHDYPERHYYWNQLGVAYYLNEQYPQALEAFSHALGECELAEEKSTILSNRAQALLNMGRKFDALDSAVWALQHDDLNANAYWYRGIVRMELGELQKAFLDFERALVLNYADGPWYLNYSDN